MVVLVHPILLLVYWCASVCWLQVLTSAYRSFWTWLVRRSASSYRKGYSYLCRNQNRWWKRCWFAFLFISAVFKWFFPTPIDLFPPSILPLFLSPESVTCCQSLRTMHCSPFLNVPSLFSHTFFFLFSSHFRMCQSYVMSCRGKNYWFRSTCPNCTTGNKFSRTWASSSVNPQTSLLRGRWPFWSRPLPVCPLPL